MGKSIKQRCVFVSNTAFPSLLLGSKHSVAAWYVKHSCTASWMADCTVALCTQVAEQVEQGILTFREARDKREAEQHWKVVQQEIRNEWHKNNPWPHRSPAE
jgi:hypothetical protein